MSQTMRQPVFPRGVILGAGALLLASIGLAGTARLTNSNHVVMPPTYPVAQRDLLFVDLADGGVGVRDAATGDLVTKVAPTTGGFLRGIMRGLVRSHRLANLPPHSSFRLTRWADGRLSIEDPATHDRYDLGAFGATNEQVFARLLETNVSEGPGAK